MSKILIPPKYCWECRANLFCFTSLPIHAVLPLKNLGAVHTTHLINTHLTASQVFSARTEQYLGKAAPPRAPSTIITFSIIFYHSNHGVTGLTRGRSLPEPDREHQLSAAACILLHQPISPSAPTQTFRLDNEVIPAQQLSKVHITSHQSRSDCKSHFSSVQGNVSHVPEHAVLVVKQISGGQSAFSLHPALG